MDEGNLLIALESYFDGSYQGNGWRNGALVSLAGFATDDTIWREFDRKWNEILQRDVNRPRAKYLHMREACSGEGEFSLRNGWNLSKVQMLLSDLIVYMSSLDKKKFRQFACTVNLEAHRKLTAEGRALSDPIEICNRNCPESVLGWYAIKYPDKIVHSAHFFFDLKEPFKDPFEEKWKEKKSRIVDSTASVEFWSLIKTVTTADMREKPGLQAADLLAWASNRSASKDADKLRLAYLEPALKAFVPSTWAYWNEDALRRGRVKP